MNVKQIITGFFRPPKKEYKDEEIPIQKYQDDIVNYVKNEFERRKEERYAFELQWRLNMNFLVGNQYCDIDPVTQTIQEIDKVYWYQEREVYNHIAPIVETRLSKLGLIRPTMLVRPASSEIDDIASAKVGTAVVKNIYNKLGMQQEINTANAWSEVCGTVFYKEVWDPNAGQLVGYVGGEPVYEGDVVNIVIPAFECFPDSSYNDDLDKCKSFIHAYPMHVEDIEMIWGVRLEGRELDVFSMDMATIGLGGLGYNATIPRITTTTKKDQELVMEYYERPSKQYPEGRLIIVAGDELLYYGALPYRNGEDGKRDFPFVKQVCIERPGCFWGTTVIERCIPVQRAYNAVRNRKKEFLNRVAIGIFECEEGAYDAEDLEDEGLPPGKILVRKQGAQPGRFLDGPQSIPAFSEEENRLLNEFILISGVSELSRASDAPADVGSGVALEILREQDDTRLSLTAENLRLAIQKVAKHWLRLYKQFAVGPRIAKVVGESNEVNVIYWQASDLTSDDVIFDTENELAQSSAQRKSMVITLLQMGVFNDPETGAISKSTRAKLLEMLQLGNWEHTTSLDELQIACAQRENAMLERGEAPVIEEFHDDDIHITEHNRFRLSHAYQELKKQRPDLTDILDDHIKLHEASRQFKYQKAMYESMQQMPMQLQTEQLSEQLPTEQEPIAEQSA